MVSMLLPFGFGFPLFKELTFSSSGLFVGFNGPLALAVRALPHRGRIYSRVPTILAGNHLFLGHGTVHATFLPEGPHPVAVTACHLALV